MQIAILLINAGPGGRCCHLAISCRNRSEGLVPELSLIFCATGFDVVQLSFQSTEVISGVERLQFVFEGLPQPLAHQRTKITHQRIVGIKHEPLTLALAPHQAGLTQLAQLSADV